MARRRLLCTAVRSLLVLRVLLRPRENPGPVRRRRRPTRASAAGEFTHPRSHGSCAKPREPEGPVWAPDLPPTPGRPSLRAYSPPNEFGGYAKWKPTEVGSCASPSVPNLVWEETRRRRCASGTRHNRKLAGVQVNLGVTLRWRIWKGAQPALAVACGGKARAVGRPQLRPANWITGRRAEARNDRQRGMDIRCRGPRNAGLLGQIRVGAGRRGAAPAGMFALPRMVAPTGEARYGMFCRPFVDQIDTARAHACTCPGFSV